MHNFITDNLTEICSLCGNIHFRFFMIRKENDYICIGCKKICNKYNTDIFDYSIQELKKCIKEQKSVKEIIQEEHRENYIKNREKEFLLTLQDIKYISPKISKKFVPRQFLKNFPYYDFCSIRKNTPNSTLENFVVIDTETTGLHPSSDEILEISAIKFIDSNPVECLSTLVRPKTKISEQVTSINHITNDLVQHSPNINCIIEDFSNFIHGFNIVGYNLDFDLKFLYVNGLKLFDEKRKFFDVLDICKKYFGKNTIENFKLDTICEVCNLYRPQAHRATEDALATGILFRDIGNKIKMNNY